MSDAREAATQCAICLEDLGDVGTTHRLEECGHEFHCGCVIAWFRTNHECPLCRGTPAIRMSHMDVQQRCEMLLASPPDVRARELAVKIARSDARWKKAQRKLAAFDRESAMASALKEAKRAYWQLVEEHGKAQMQAEERVQRARRALSTHRAPLLESVRRHEKASRANRRALGLHGLGSDPPRVVTSTVSS